MNNTPPANVSGSPEPLATMPPVTPVSCGNAEALAQWLRENNGSTRVVGAGTWLNAGRPVHATHAVGTQSLAGVVEYVPGDLTMTVRAGTTLAQLDEITAAEGQWLGIDPAGSLSGTIGATVATASTGPLAHGIGRMRDIVLGLEVVTGDGRVTRSGGKVVKNVAGFDLVRLQTGAWGTLGVITEMSLRLRALPEVDQTVAIALDARRPLTAHLEALRDLALAPLAIELLGATLAERLGIGNGTMFLVRLGGNETRVTAQRKTLAALGTLAPVAANVWQSLRAIETENAAVARVSHLPSELARTWAHVYEELSTVALAPGLLRASVSRGMIRVVIPPPSDLNASEYETAVAVITRALAPPGGHVVWEQLPASAWHQVPSAVADSISTGLQHAFDPGRRLNPGILGAPLS